MHCEILCAFSRRACLIMSAVCGWSCVCICSQPRLDHVQTHTACSSQRYGGTGQIDMYQEHHQKPTLAVALLLNVHVLECQLYLLPDSFFCSAIRHLSKTDIVTVSFGKGRNSETLYSQALIWVTVFSLNGYYTLSGVSINGLGAMPLFTIIPVLQKCCSRFQYVFLAEEYS